MCGISGFIDPNITNPNEQKRIITDMLHSIVHRGPDNTDHWIKNEVVLGHNRLSILDLSESANQPFIRGGNILVYNGEVYNYVEIRKELIKLGHQFTTDSDTEVILAAYEEWGTECVTYFIGMWAFALWDEREQHLFCSRDRFGIKPFYFIQEDQKFYFGSEYKALKNSPIFKNTHNYQQIYRGLQLGWITYGSETYFENLQQLPAAHSLIFKNGQVIIKPYWQLESIQKKEISFQEASDQFRALFLDSIRLHMRSDVIVGGCLSGGLDSSSIASCIGTLFPETPFNTYTIFFDGKNEVDERPYAKEVIKRYSTLRPYYYQPMAKNVAEDFERVMECQEVPIAGSSAISQYFVMKLAAEHNAKVLIDGQGADEYLAGYMHSFYRLIGGSFRNLQLRQGFKQHQDYVKLQGFKAKENITRLLKSILAGVWKEQKLYDFEYNNFYTFLPKNKETIFNLKDCNSSRLNEFLHHLTVTTSLPSLLHCEDRNSMAFSIESRVPFLDHRLVEFVFSLPDEFKIKDGTTKYILRSSMDGILPQAIKERKDKKGFVTPGEAKWLRGPLKHLLNMDLQRLDMLDKKKVEKVLANYKKGSNKEAILVWRLATLHYWLSK